MLTSGVMKGLMLSQKQDILLGWHIFQIIKEVLRKKSFIFQSASGSNTGMKQSMINCTHF